MITEGYKNSIHLSSTSYYLRLVTTILAIVGALNWGFVGLNNFDLVAYLFGPMSALSRIIYILVGIAGIYLLSTLTGIKNKK
ncbi:MAG: DUF378 domain-containing protein [Holosporales bacterium]|nr:DUF378 domain-containing protein [Holosporales bacterium]